jgi:predicted nucleotidyltransferase
MNCLGVVAEYNPFHNGHAWHLSEARRITGAEGVICVMSGDFLQRGEPAVMSKWARTEAALHCGADLVIQIPVFYSTGSADIFAHGAITLLSATGVVTDICFGSETGSLETLQDNLDRLFEDAGIQDRIQQAIREGLPYPRAMSMALDGNLDHHSPNDILGLEYLRALRKMGSSMKPWTIIRAEAGYGDQQLPESGSIASATSIRAAMMDAFLNGADAFPDGADAIAKVVTPFVPEIMASLIRTEAIDGRCPVGWKDFASQVLTRFRSMIPDEVSAHRGVGTVLGRKLLKASWANGTVREMAESVRSRNVTWSRIYRAIAAVLLGISTPAADLLARRPGYGRVLGFNEKGKAILAAMRERATLPFINSPDRAWPSYNRWVSRSREPFEPREPIQWPGMNRPFPDEAAFAADLQADRKASGIWSAALANPGDRSKAGESRKPVMISTGLVKGN